MSQRGRVLRPSDHPHPGISSQAQQHTYVTPTLGREGGELQVLGCSNKNSELQIQRERERDPGSKHKVEGQQDGSGGKAPSLMI